MVSPCEGTGYEIGSMSIVKGARNLGRSEEVLRLGADAGSPGDRRHRPAAIQLPSNPATPVPPEAPDPSKLKLINYDFEKYGSSDERKRLLKRWTDEVKNAN